MSTLDRRDRGDMIITFKILKHMVEMDTRFIKMNTESWTRKRTMKIKISRSKIEIRKENKDNMELSKSRNHQFKNNWCFQESLWPKEKIN